MCVCVCVHVCMCVCVGGCFIYITLPEQSPIIDNDTTLKMEGGEKENGTRIYTKFVDNNV